MAPQISIIVPVYNGATFLSETIETLLNQTFRDFELLLVDDGSTDNSVAIMESFTDPRIRVIQQERNGGLCQTLNRAIAEAQAPLIARNDQDDVSRPDRLERQLAALSSQPDATALFCFNSKMGGNREWSNQDKLEMSTGKVRLYSPERDGCMLASTMLARTDALRQIGGFRQAYYPTDDWDLQLRLAERGKVLILQEPLVAYRFHGGAHTYRTFGHMQQTIRWALDSHRRRSRKQPELPFDQFVASQNASAFARLNRRRMDSAKLHMRLAGQRFLDGFRLRAFGHGVLALLLNPGDLVRRMRSLLSSTRVTAS